MRIGTQHTQNTIGRLAHRPKYRSSKKRSCLLNAKAIALREKAAEGLVSLSSSGWKGFKPCSSLNELAIQVLKKKLTPYATLQSNRKLLQELLDAEKISLP